MVVTAAMAVTMVDTMAAITGAATLCIAAPIILATMVVARDTTAEVASRITKATDAATQIVASEFQLVSRELTS